MILIATPMYGNQCTAIYHKSVLRLVQSFERESYPYDVMIGLNESLVDRARNNMACDFLKTKFQKLLFIDADIEFDPDDVAMLLEHDVDLVAGVYCMKKPDSQWYAVWKDGKLVKDLGEGSLEEVDFMGTGFMMIDRNVFERMISFYPEIKNDDPVETWGFFNRMKYNGVMLSEDYSFCQRWKDLGEKIYADTRVRLIHHGMYPYGA